MHFPAHSFSVIIEAWKANLDVVRVKNGRILIAVEYKYMML